jgi:hypothetical protein
MKTRISISRATLVVSFFFLSSLGVFASTDQTTTERILRENKRFVEFVNICITNFADNRKEDFRKAYVKHFNADIAYLQSDYKRAFRQVYASQGEMEKLYRDMVKDFYLEDSKSILDKLAPGIIRSKNTQARLYLTLGYRDRTVGWTYYTVADASNPKLYSYKLYKYVDAIQMSRRAKRFAFLALFESQGVEVKRKIYNQLCKSEKTAHNPFFNRFVDLKDDEYIKEMNKDYYEVPEETKKGAEMKKGDEVKSAGQVKKEPGQAPEDLTSDMVFEKKVERRARFRNEIKTARYLINGEFDKAEDILRKYIDDFNFKLISATFDVLSAPGGEAAADKVDFEKFKVHLTDNYSRYAKKSLLDGIIDSVKVEDSLADKAQDKLKADEQSGEAARKDAKTVLPEKKEEKAIKEGGKDAKDEKKDLKDEKK